MWTPLLPEVVLGGADRNGDWPQECGWYGPGYYGYGMGCDTGAVKLAEGCSNAPEGRPAMLGMTGRKRAKKAPIVVNEESDGFAGLAENVVAPQGSVQELTGLGRSTQSTESHQELRAGDSATSSTRIAHQDGVWKSTQASRQS